MKVAILAGGFGTRLSEETIVKPKPMVEIGGFPIIWHIMKLYSHYGYNDFVILLGYKGFYIKEYFANYFLHRTDVTIDLKDNSMEFYKTQAEPWKITLVDTGIKTMTGGRIKRARKYIGDETFMLTYGDGVADVNISNLVNYHKEHNKVATITAVKPSGKFGSLDIGLNNNVETFIEKPQGDGQWINGGFFVLEPKIFDYIENDNVFFEKEPLEKLSKDNQLIAYKHKGFWKSMDTLSDNKTLNSIWDEGNPPWKIWEN